MIAQFIPFSIGNIIPIVISILFNTLLVWLSAQVVIGKATLQDSLIFSAVTYFVLIFLNFIPIPSLPLVSTVLLVELVIKSLLAMKFFDAEFRQGISIAGVQMLFGTIIALPF